MLVTIGWLDHLYLMAELKISSIKDLIRWQEAKPLGAVQVVAMRVALRMLPFVCDPKGISGDGLSAGLIIPTLRASILSSMSARAPVTVLYSASNASNVAAASISTAFNPASDNIESSDAAFVAAHAAFASAKAAAAGCSGNVVEAAHFSSIFLAAHAADIWSEISADCAALETEMGAFDLLTTQLWQETPNWFIESWGRASDWLRNSQEGFAIWDRWYSVRIAGNRLGFLEFDEAADIEFHKRLLTQTDPWWERESALVNADITAWVEELAPAPPPSEEDLTQNPRAITFTATDSGQIGLRKTRNTEELDKNEDARLRHKEVLEEARLALEASTHGATQATDVERPLQQYIEALGEELDGVAPSLLIARGEKLRRFIASRKVATGFAIPFSETQEAAMQSWQVAHNLFVGLDPYLSGIERMAAGPDAPVTVLDLDAIKKIIQSAQNANIPDGEAAEALHDAADNVPFDAPDDDRRIIQATEALKNFVRGIGALVKKHGWKAVGGGYVGCCWVQSQITWLEQVFAQEPSILEILQWIAALPLKVT